MILTAAMLIDVLIGDPNWLPHPVAGIGWLVSRLEKRLYGNGACWRGCVLAAGVTAAAGLAAWGTVTVAAILHTWLGSAAEALLVAVALAFRSLRDAAMAIYRPLADGSIAAARMAVAGIVGRDTQALDEASVSRAAIESVAESSIDGIIAPLFWAAVGACFGHPAVAVWMFKAVSTMDSMIGYEDDRYRHFGTCAARADDVLNWIPARLGTLAIIVAGMALRLDWKHAGHVVLRDRLKHRSPNSAHSESAFAALLGIRLGGGAAYGGEWEARPVLNAEGREAASNDVRLAVTLLDASTVICIVITFLAELACLC